MIEAFLTTRHGSISKLEVYKYDFSEKVLVDNDSKNRLIHWLQKQQENPIHKIELNSFYAFSRLKNESTPQFKYSKATTLEPPFDNTQFISNLIGNILRTEIGKTYKQFLNDNIFIVETVNLDPFILYKCFEFNVEVFPSGNYLIHLLPLSKIVSGTNPIDKAYLDHLRASNRNNSQTNEMKFSLVNLDKFYRKKIDLLDSNFSAVLDSIFNEDPKFIGTFDYHFLANYSPELFGKVTELTLKDLKQTILFLDKVIDKINLPNYFQLHPDKYFKVDIHELEKKNNLLVGIQQSETITILSRTKTQYGLRTEYTRDEVSKEEVITIFLKKEELIERLLKVDTPITLKAKIEQREGWKHPYIMNLFTDANIYFECNKQSASYHNGIYQPVSDYNILPVVCGNLSIKYFYDLLARFNKNAKNFEVFPAISVKENEDINLNEIENTINQNKNKTLLAILCKHQMPRDFFDPLKKRRLKYQVYQGDIDMSSQNASKLSNFTVKCLEKIGGLTSVIKDSYVNEQGYFIGIDLGHTTFGTDKFSNLAMVLFDNKGMFLNSTISKNLPRQENLVESDCKKLMQNFNKFITRNGLPKPEQIIIHRDGKLHLDDIRVIRNSIELVWGQVKIDIIEIIKSGFPVIAIKKDKNEVVNPESGSSYQDNTHKYAILVTNTQADEHNVILSPIIVKQKFGETEFDKIVDQVYWFTKIYTNNLFNSTRLPATTLKANNIVGTAQTRHTQTYLG